MRTKRKLNRRSKIHVRSIKAGRCRRVRSRRNTAMQRTIRRKKTVLRRLSHR